MAERAYVEETDRRGELTRAEIEVAEYAGGTGVPGWYCDGDVPVAAQGPHPTDSAAVAALRAAGVDMSRVVVRG